MTVPPPAPTEHTEAAGILTHRSDHLDQSERYLTGFSMATAATVVPSGMVTGVFPLHDPIVESGRMEIGRAASSLRHDLRSWPVSGWHVQQFTKIAATSMLPEEPIWGLWLRTRQSVSRCVSSRMRCDASCA